MILSHRSRRVSNLRKKSPDGHCLTGAFLYWNQWAGLFGHKGIESLGFRGHLTLDFPNGVPIGNYLSQYFANLFLAYFDHWIKEAKRVKYYWRYADDIVILAPDKQSLHDLLHEIRAYFCKLQLKVKRNYQVFPVDKRGIDFLGFVFYHTHTLLRKNIKQNLCRRVAKLNKRKKKPTKEQYKQAICSWWGWCKYSDSIHFFNKLSNSFPYEIKFDRAKRPL